MSLDEWLAHREDRCPVGYHAAQHPSLCSCNIPIAPAELSTSAVDAHWPTFLAALRRAVVDGHVQQKNVRPLIRGVIPPHIIGLCYRRARDRHVLVEVDHERSDDKPGRNAGRMEPRYELRAA